MVRPNPTGNKIMKAVTFSAPALAPARQGTVGFVTACAIVIANIIGTGVFTSLGFQVRDIHSSFALLMLWVVGGIAALCGALSYAELGAALPRSGGEYHFLSTIYHPALGFMAGIVSATVGFAAPIALAAMAFGKYFHGVFNFGVPALLSFAVIWIVAAFHLRNLRVGSVFQNIWTLTELLLIGAFITAGFLLPAKQPVAFLPARADIVPIFGAPFAVALVYVMYSYSGWNAATYITGEIRQPGRNLPRALFAGTAIVMVIYVLLNGIFLAAAPQTELSGQLEVGLIAGKHIFGAKGARVVGAVICIGLISAISSMTWIGPRVTMSMGEDHWLLRWLGRKSDEGVPIRAIGLQLVITSLLLSIGSFEFVAIYIQFSLLLCSLLTVLGVIVLRNTHPEIARPYRVWAYPLPPLLFATIAIWMMIYLLHSRPVESLLALATMLGGFALYFFAGKHLVRTK
jgi:basic amino acid/polyamine antiporter, APA family